MNDHEIQKRLASGWNTWNTYSVLSHVLLPEGLAVNLSLKEYRSGRWLREALIGGGFERARRLLRRHLPEIDQEITEGAGPVSLVG